MLFRQVLTTLLHFFPHSTPLGLINTVMNKLRLDVAGEEKTEVRLTLSFPLILKILTQRTEGCSLLIYSRVGGQLIYAPLGYHPQ